MERRVEASRSNLGVSATGRLEVRQVPGSHLVYFECYFPNRQLHTSGKTSLSVLVSYLQ